MPRRMIDSTIWHNEKFGNLSLGARVLFIGSFSNADDDGRLKASPRFLRALVFPYDPDITIEQVKEWRDELSQDSLVGIYTNDNHEYMVLMGWYEHQSIRKDRYHDSVLPPPPDNLLASIGLPPDNQPSDSGCLSIVESSIGKDSIEKSSSSIPNIFSLYEANIAMLTPISSTELQSMEQDYPEAWIKEAIQIAVNRNKRNLGYIRGILRRWDENGKDSGAKKEVVRPRTMVYRED